MRRMNGRPVGELRSVRPEVIGLALSLLAAAVIGFFLATQILTPNKRILEVFMGVTVLTAAFLMPNRHAVALLLFIIPFPHQTTMGSTTVIFAFVIFAFWLLKTALGYERKPTWSGLDVPILILVMMYFISLVNVVDYNWHSAIDAFKTLISSIFIFYLVVNLVRTKRDIQFVLNALILSFVLVCVLAMVELWFPGHIHYFDFLRGKILEKTEGVRVGSVLGDYELFAEYLAIFIPILLIRIVTEKVVLKHLIWVPLLIMAVMLLLGTATRGAFFALIVGVVYLVWIARRILNFQKFLPVLIFTLLAFYVSSIALNQYTQTASLFGRLEKTKLVSGMPDTRARAWTQGWQRALEYPWIGHGPYYPVGLDEKHVMLLYPHSLPLYLAYIVGFPGAVAFYVVLFLALGRGIAAARRFATEKTPFAYTVVLLSSTLVIFLVDEIKISFLRYDQTQHFTWTMLALMTASSRVALQLVKERRNTGGASLVSNS